MKVLLIYPDTSPESVIPKKLINIEPLGLEYLAGAIPGHEVQILDIKIENRWKKKIEDIRNLQRNPNRASLLLVWIVFFSILSSESFIIQFYYEILICHVFRLLKMKHCAHEVKHGICRKRYVYRMLSFFERNQK